MNRFKIKTNEFIKIMMIAVPIATFIYFINNEKMTIKMKFAGGNAVTINSCDINDGIKKLKLITNYDIILIKNKFLEKDKQFLSSDDNIYTIEAKYFIGNYEKLIMKFNEIKFEIEAIEHKNFNDFYKNSQIHCRSSNKNMLFKMVPAGDNVIIEKKLSISRKNLYFLMILPFVILYLILIAYKFILENRVIKNEKSL